VALRAAREHAKQRMCSHCGQTGFMIGHGYAKGNGANAAGCVRGQRLACSKRNQRRGCGRTMCIWLATVVRGRGVLTSTISAILQAGLDAASRHAGWRAMDPLPITMRHCYRLWHRLERDQSRIRTTLTRCCDPPAVTSSETRPLAQLRMHLQHTCVGAMDDVDALALF
jgi:hypothetical protein